MYCAGPCRFCPAREAMPYSGPANTVSTTDTTTMPAVDAIMSFGAAFVTLRVEAEAEEVTGVQYARARADANAIMGQIVALNYAVVPGADPGVELPGPPPGPPSSPAKATRRTAATIIRPSTAAAMTRNK